MAKIIGRTETGVLVEMAANDVKKISGLADPQIGDAFNLATIYNKLAWLLTNKAKLKTLAQQVRDFGNNLDGVVDISGIGGA